MNVGSRLIRGSSNFSKFQSPKTWRWRQELNANPLPLFARLALKDHPALLIFQRLRIRQNQHLAVVNLMLQQQQSPVCVDHHGLARLFEFLSVVRPALSLHFHFVEGPSTAPARC